MSPAASPTPIRVLVVDDVAGIRENLMRLLALEDDMEVVGAAPDGRLAVAAARELAPDVVVMDITMPTMDGIAAAEVIRVECPGVQVVMMSIHDQSEELRRAMLAGAREFLVKPFGTDQFVTAIRRVAARRRQDQASAVARVVEVVETGGGRVLSVFGPTGGVGRTSIACNLAVALRQATGKRVALVDANLQFGDVGLVLNAPPAKTIVDLLPHIADLDAELIGDVVANHPSGIDLLLAPARPEMAELVSAEYLKRILSKMREDYDYVVVDTDSSCSEAVLAALDLSDRIFVLLTPEMPAVKNTRLFLDMAAKIGYEREKLSLVLNRVDPNGGTDVVAIERVLGQPITFRIVADGRLLSQAMNQGQPFVLLNRKAEVSRGVFELASASLVRADPQPVPSRAAAPVQIALRGALAELTRIVRRPVRVAAAASS